MSTQALRTTLLVLLSLNVLQTLIALVYSFDLEQFGFGLRHLDVFDMAVVCLMLVQWVVVGLGITGIVRAIQRWSAPLPNILHFPLIWYFTSGLFSWSFAALRRPDPMRPEMTWPLWSWIHLFLFVVYAATCILYFAREKTPAASGNLRWVSSWSRMFAWLLDILLVMTIFFVNIRSLAYIGSVLEDIPFFNDSPYPVMSIMLFLYFFCTEVVFMRTLGKAANGSYIVFERGRVLSVLWRTLSRFIPLEAFSFIGRSEGWHDTLSRTTVRRVSLAKLNAEDPILRADQLV